MKFPALILMSLGAASLVLGAPAKVAKPKAKAKPAAAKLATNASKFESKLKRSDPKFVDPLLTVRPGDPTSDASGATPGARIGSLIKQLDTGAATGGASSGSSDSGGGSSGGAGGGSGGSGSGSQSIVMNDNAAKGQGPGEQPENKSGGQLSGGGGGGGPKGKIQAFDKWFPACVFISPNVPNGNTMVKGVVDMAAACGVNLVVFPFYLKGTPGGPQAINDQARKSCNAIQGMGSQGVNRVASATVTGNPVQAAQMCGASNKDRDTCEDLTFNPGETYLMRYRMTGRGAGVDPTGSGIVGRNTSQALGTTLFRQITGLPYGAGAGLGLGNWNEGDSSAAGLAKTDGLNDFGCQQLRNSSFPNDGRWKWNSAQETYVVKGDSDRLFDLGRPIFTPPRPPGDGGKAQSIGGAVGAGGGSGGSGGGAASIASVSGSGGGGGAGSSGGGSTNNEAGVTGGHKKPPGGFGVGGAGSVDSSVASTKGGTGAKTISGGYGTGADGGGESAGGSGASAGADEVVSVAGARGPASVGGGGKSGFTVEINDNNSKFGGSLTDPQLGGGKGQLGSSGGMGGSVGVLDPSYLKKTKAEEEAELNLKAVSLKRPRTILEGSNEPVLSPEILKRMKLGERLKTGGYKGKVTNGGITTMRRELSTRR